MFKQNSHVIIFCILIYVGELILTSLVFIHKCHINHIN